MGKRREMCNNSRCWSSDEYNGVTDVTYAARGKRGNNQRSSTEHLTLNSPEDTVGLLYPNWQRVYLRFYTVPQVCIYTERDERRVTNGARTFRVGRKLRNTMVSVR